MTALMLRSAVSRGVACVVCIVAATTIAVAQPRGTEPPGSVRKQAWPPGVLGEIQGVLREGVPVGLVLGLSDRIDVPPSSASSLPPPDIADPREPVALQMFRAHWGSAYSITQANDVVTVTSPRINLCQVGLARTVLPHTYSGAPFEILFQIASTFDESLRKLPPPGMVHGGGAAMTEDARESLTRQITITLDAGSLQQSLSRLVSSAPGLGWLAWEKCDASGKCGCYISLVTATSVLWTSYDASTGLRPQSRDRAK
jgi:hypothetical protein